MTRAEILAAVTRIVNSCLTYDQLSSCMSFLENGYVCKDITDRLEVFRILQTKAYSMRIGDLREHNLKLKEILQ
jgi:hypothetical protein